MSCTSCNSNRLIDVSSKASDLHYVSVPHLDLESDGYFPSVPGIGAGDYVELTACLDCGKIQGQFPISDEDLKNSFNP